MTCLLDDARASQLQHCTMPSFGGLAVEAASAMEAHIATVGVDPVIGT